MWREFLVEIRFEIKRPEVWPIIVCDLPLLPTSLQKKKEKKKKENNKSLECSSLAYLGLSNFSPTAWKVQSFTPAVWLQRRLDTESDPLFLTFLTLALYL